MRPIVFPQRYGVGHRAGKGAQDEFNAAGDANLVEDPKKIILDGMLAQIQLGCDFSVARALCDQMHDRLLTLS